MFTDDAELRTPSWLLRHGEPARRQFVVWRWAGMQRHLHRVLLCVLSNRTIDFGGFDGPLGFCSIVVDPQADCKTLDDVTGSVDCIFSSHALEHVEHLEQTIAAFHAKLDAGGILLLHVPAWTCKRWRAEEYSNGRQSPHRHTFALSCDDDAELWSIPHVCLDTLLSEWFDIEIAEHCGDNSLFILGIRK